MIQSLNNIDINTLYTERSGENYWTKRDDRSMETRVDYVCAHFIAPSQIEEGRPEVELGLSHREPLTCQLNYHMPVTIMLNLHRNQDNVNN